MARWSHTATAYILRWNKPDYKEIIGVFLTQKDLEDFQIEHFDLNEEKNLKVEFGR
jgi:hypothetical protein